MEQMTTEQRIAQFTELLDPYINYDFINHLIKCGFLDAPASIHHHGTYAGALFDHSLVVTKALLNLTQQLNLSWAKERSPYIVGMFHDLCKLDNYQRVSGDGEAWEYNNAPLLTGHGEKSVIMLQQWVKLTEEEMLCIRWHLGAFDDKANWNGYTEAVGKYPNVLYTHTADMMASQVMGV